MISAIPAYIAAIVLVTNVSIAVGVWSLVASAARRAELRPDTRRTIQAGSAVIIGGWLALALLLAPAPESLLGRDRFYLSPLIPLFALVPAFIIGGALSASATLRRVATHLDAPGLVGIQLYRIIGAVFLILLAQARLPAHFAVPAGWGDVAIGLTAPPIALALARGFSGARSTAIAWNVLGLGDLVVAVGMGTGYLAPLLAPDVGQVPPVPAMGVFPLILVPTFAVPVSVILHLLALAKILRDRRVAAPLVPRAAM